MATGAYSLGSANKPKRVMRIQEDTRTNNTRKRLKADEHLSTNEYSQGNSSQMLQREGNLGEKRTEKASNSRWQTPSLKFSPFSQEKLRQIYGQEKDLNTTLEFEMLQKEGNLGDKRTEKASNSKWQMPSLKFPPFSQEQLRQIYGQKKVLDTTLEFEDSEESEEDDGLTEEEFQQSEGCMLTMKALDAMFGKPKT